MYILCYWSKSQVAEKVLAACSSREKVHDVACGLNGTIGYISGLGLYSQSADGCYYCREIPLVEPGDLEGRFQEWLDKRKDAVL